MKESELVLGVVVGVGLYLLARERGPRGGPVPGGVQLGGSLGRITMGQAAVMGQLKKQAFENVQVRFDWVADTRDKNTKLLVPWSYMVMVRMGHNTVAGWKDAAQLGFPNTGTFSTITPLVLGSQTANYNFSAPDDNNQIWDIRVRLSAATPVSDTELKPSPSEFALVDSDEVPGAFISVSQGVELGGSLGLIAVSQQRRSVGRMGL